MELRCGWQIKVHRLMGWRFGFGVEVDLRSPAIGIRFLCWQVEAGHLLGWPKFLDTNNLSDLSTTINKEDEEWHRN